MKHAISPPRYYRNSIKWIQWIGKTGKVIGITTQQVQQSNSTSHLPLQIALVEFEQAQLLLPIALGGPQITIGTKVICTLRKLSSTTENAVIEYGLVCRSC